MQAGDGAMATASVAENSPVKQSELREHWPLALAASLGVMVSFASVFIYSFSVLLKQLTADFGWSRAQVSAGFSVAALTVAAVSPAIGKLTDRIGVRPVIVTCSAIFGLGFCSLSLLTGNIWHFYAALFVVGIAGNGTTQLTWAKAIATRFQARRGTALSLMMVGVGIGSMLVPWATTAIIERWGWRAAYLTLGGAVAVCGPALALLALRGGHGQARRAVGTHADGAVTKRFTPVFIKLLGGFFLVSLGTNGCLAHLVAMLTDRGLTAATAAAMAGVLGLASVCGRLITGPLIDRYFAARIGFLFVAASALGFALFAAGGGVWASYAAVALIGIATGAEADFFPYLISRYMGVGSFTELYGYAFSAYAVAGAIGPLLMGMIYDQSKSYTMGIAGAVVTTLAAAALLLTLPRYERG